MKISKLLIFTLLLFFLLGTVSANDLNSTNVTNTDNIKEIHVATTGDDLNTGSSESPYATIGKAITNVNASDKATIYLSKGTFSTDDDADFDINLNHKVYGGDLKFIGAGADQTFLDGQSTFRFAKLGENTNITFKNITFINFKASNGGTLYSEGVLNIDNCIFKNSYSTGDSGGAIYSAGPSPQFIFGQKSTVNVLSIKNSQFVDCSINSDGNDFEQGGGAIYASYLDSLYLENNSFINTRIKDKCAGSAILYNSILGDESEVFVKCNKFVNLTGFVDASMKIISSNSTILDNIFINCSNPSQEYSIVYLGDGNYIFKNNSFINSSNDVGNIHVGNKISIFGCYISPVGLSIDSQVNIGNYEINNGLDLNIKLKDDMGNIIDKTNFGLVFSNENNSYNYFASKNGDKYHINFNEIPEMGIYNIYYRLTEDLTDNNRITTAKINYSYVPIDLWVSPNGYDGNNGSEINPFLTIQHAIDFGFEKSFNVVLHLKEGVYSGEGNVELNIDNKGSLQIIGMSNNNTIIDGNNKNWFIHVNTVVSIKNLKFTNGYSKDNDLMAMGNGIVLGGNLYLENCVIENCTAIDNYVLNNAIFNNLNFSNNRGGIFINVFKENMIFNNSCFINNHNSYGLFVIRGDGVTISNSKFINNTAENYAAAILSSSSFTSKNNIYIDNSAPHDSLFSTYVANFENDTYINNKATSGNFAIVGVQMESEVYSNLSFKNCRFINNSASKEGIVGIKQGVIINSSFINNTAEYGGAIVVYPVKYPTRLSNNNYYGIEINNTLFKGNLALINGNDIYLKEKPNSYNKYKTDLLNLIIDYMDKNITGLFGTLTVNITGPCNAIVGGGRFDIKLNNEIVGSCEIINGIIDFEYDGFENGVYLFDGNTLYSTDNSAITSGKITVEQSQLSNICELWISNDGDDNNGNGDKDNPFKSISKAINKGKFESRNILVHLGKGVYGGDLNTALTLSSMYNVTLVGAGVDNTIISGDNSTYFAKISEGPNRILISNLTISQMGVNGEIPSVIINSGSKLHFNNVIITKFNNLIENNGNLYVENSIFEKNLGLISGGNLVINNTHISYCQGKILGNVTINNSVIKDIVASYGFELIGGKKCIIENTLISNDCNNESLNSWRITNETLSSNPAIIITSNHVNIRNTAIINNFSSQIKEYQTTYGDGTLLSLFGYAYNHVERNVSCYNSSFSNFNYLWCVNTYPHVEFNFDRCVFNNISLIAQSQTPGEKSKFIISNSVFLNSGHMIDRYNRGDREDPVCVFENNYWGSNDKPIINYYNPGKAKSFEPNNWIVLNEINGILKFQLTDGENTIDYDGEIPLKIAYASTNGEIVPIVTVDGKSYPVIFEGENIILASNPIENPIIKEIADNTIFAEDLTLKYGDEANFTARFTNLWGDPLANAEVTFSIDNKNYTALTDENGSAGFNVDLDSGVYDAIITNPYTKQVNVNTIVVNKAKPTMTVNDVSTVYNADDYLVVTLMDTLGSPMVGAVISVDLNGIHNMTADENGTVTVPVRGLVPNVYQAKIVFNGDANHEKTLTTANVTVEKASSMVSASSLTTVYNGGKYLTVTLRDSHGNPIGGAAIYVNIKGEKTITTNKNGEARLTMDGIAPNAYTAKVTFRGDGRYTGSSTTAKVTVKKATPKLTAKKATFKAKTKTKKYTITLKDNKGKAIKKAKVTLKVKGKTYKATTNNKGKATFKITKLTKKGKHKATIKYTGNNNFKAVTKTIKYITIK